MNGTGISVVAVRSREHLDAARALIREYGASLPESAQISLRHQGFEEELASLPGKFAPPAGEMLLAFDAGRAVGVVALRPLNALAGDPSPVCEMKRLYVSPSARGLGAGRVLCERLLSHARAAGYRMMKLDTEPGFAAAVGLYRSLGFVDIPRYNDDPVSCTLWMGRAL